MAGRWTRPLLSETAVTPKWAIDFGFAFLTARLIPEGTVATSLPVPPAAIGPGTASPSLTDLEPSLIEAEKPVTRQASPGQVTLARTSRPSSFIFTGPLDLVIEGMVDAGAGLSGPCGPVSPVGPEGPDGPDGPLVPVEPVTPVDPVTPVFPVDPVAPVVPVGPVGPTRPRPDNAAAVGPGALVSKSRLAA